MRKGEPQKKLKVIMMQEEKHKLKFKFVSKGLK